MVQTRADPDVSHNILAIDQEKDTWERVANHLESKGYRLLIACSLDQGLKHLDSEQVDLVLLHETLPNIDYLEAIRLIKARYVVPLVVIAESSNTVRTVTSLELGADDFISAPLKLDELSARIKANLRLVEVVQQETAERTLEENAGTGLAGEGIAAIQFDQWRLDLLRQQLLDQQENPIELTPGELKLLTALARAPRVALSRDRLLEETREGDAGGFDRSIDVQISRLRQKLGDSDRKQPLIRTVRSFGYMLDVDTDVIR